MNKTSLSVLAFPVAVVFLLAGCEDLTPGTQAAPVSQPAQSEVGPASAAADGLLSSIMFKNICAETLPKFRNAEAEIAELPFVQHSQTGTYYHQNVNLSVKVFSDSRGSNCSMVFGTREDATQLALLFSLGLGEANTDNTVSIDPDTGSAFVQLGHNAEFHFRPAAKDGRQQLYNAVISVRN